mmetsp:Transcript_15636/g.32442  ORF Transcript_15636/g.32442 Transcript_15636/m.32442 type:complete len:101 (+) Transcript_15636:186-488(+)
MIRCCSKAAQKSSFQLVRFRSNYKFVTGCKAQTTALSRYLIGFGVNEEEKEAVLNLMKSLLQAFARIRMDFKSRCSGNNRQQRRCTCSPFVIIGGRFCCS